MKTFLAALVLCCSSLAFAGTPSVCSDVTCNYGHVCSPNGASLCECKWPNNNSGRACCGHNSSWYSGLDGGEQFLSGLSTCNGATTVDMCCSGILDGGCCCSKAGQNCNQDSDCCGDGNPYHQNLYCDNDMEPSSSFACVCIGSGSSFTGPSNCIPGNHNAQGGCCSNSCHVFDGGAHYCCTPAGVVDVGGNSCCPGTHAVVVVPPTNPPSYTCTTN